MPTSTNVTNLKINELTEAQYDTAVQQGVIGANEISIITDAGGGDFVPQLDTLPTAGATNVGDIVQYSGATIPDVDATATGTQTAGSGLTDITVNVATFEGVEQPTGAETVEFTASVTTDSATYTTVTGSFTLVGGNLRGVFESYGWTFGPAEHNGVIVFNNSQDCYIGPEVGTMWVGTNVGVLESYGFQFSGTPTNGDVVQYSYTDGSTSWTKDSETVDINAYGVSFSGTPSDGDEITVTYTPAEKGITNGYFYQSSASYSDPSATISQTTGSGLSELAVNVDTFIATEQPTGDETVAFVANIVSESASLGTQVGTFTCTFDSDEYLARLVATWGSEWWNVTGTTDLYFVYMSGGSFALCTDSAGNNVLSYVGTDWGFDVTDDSQVQVGDYVPVIYVAGGTNWSKNGTPVTLSDYGITYSGTPVDDDTLTVVYTAPAVTGYAWEQKDVQPSSGSASGGGIDWKTSVDLPGTFKPSDWNIAPVFKINGGLPDGNYEFYYKMKVGNELYSPDYVPGEVTFKYIIKIENDYISGIFAPVIDGNCIGSTSKGRAPVNSEGIYSFGWKDGNNNMYLYTDNSAWWASDVHGYWASTDVPNCFRLSAIKNLATGQEYIAEGSLYNDESLGTSITSRLLVYAIQQSPNVPSSFYGNSFNITELPTTQTLQCTGITCYNGIWGSSTELTASLECGSDKFCARLQTFIDDYVLTIYEATGIFEDAQFIKTSSGVLYVKLNIPAGASGTIYAQYGLKDMSTDSPAAFYMQDITGQSYTALVPLKIGVTPVANYIGKILQYDGTTDANYTNGYFYKATGNIVNVPGSVDCTETTSLGKTITMDIDGFINYMVSATGYSKSTIEGWLNNSNFVYNVNDDFINWSPWGNLPNTSDVLQYITFSPAAQSGEYITWTISNYVAAHTEVQNAAWTEVKTQQSSTTPSTMPTLVVANWSSNTQTVTVQGVTASNNVIVAPAPASAADYASAGIVCTAQGANSLTFTCTQTPSNDITVNVVIL